MIQTQYLSSLKMTPVDLPGYITINLLRWRDSKWRTLFPSVLKTDGNEEVENEGGVIFGNFFEGCKLHPKVFENKVYASKFQRGKENHLFWEFAPVNDGGDFLIERGNVNYDLYYRWRNSLWGCSKCVKYPNGVLRDKHERFFFFKRKGVEKEERMTSYEARKFIYIKEYIRLVRKEPKYQLLLQWLKEGKNLLFCEVNVPKRDKRNEFGRDCDRNNNCLMTLTKVRALIDTMTEDFSHGLCLVYALLSDLES